MIPGYKGLYKEEKKGFYKGVDICVPQIPVYLK